MPLRFEQDKVHFDGHCVVDEALPLLEFLNEAANREVELSACDSMHTALFQVLAARRPNIASLPPEPHLATLVRSLAGGAGQ
jgi:1-deoxy-D-xylulose 5-phosphate reductoisomerase